MRSLRDRGVRYREARPQALAAWRKQTGLDDCPGDGIDTVQG